MLKLNLNKINKKVNLVVMAVLLENTTNTVWQAFVSLQHDASGFVHKSKLKVGDNVAKFF